MPVINEFATLQDSVPFFSSRDQGLWLCVTGLLVASEKFAVTQHSCHAVPLVQLMSQCLNWIVDLSPPGGHSVQLLLPPNLL